MHLLLKGVSILDKKSEHHQQKVDVLIENGIIQKIDTKLEKEGVATENAQGQYLSPAWADPVVHFGEPGEEHIENLATGARAAAAGGISLVGQLPDTQPEIVGKSHLVFFKDKSPEGVEVLPYATILQENGDAILNEFGDLMQFPLASFRQRLGSYLPDDVLRKALEYAKITNKRLHLYAEHFNFNHAAFVNERLHHAALGLKGNAAFAEAMNVDRILRIARYVESPVHISGVSSATTLDIIRHAKKQQVVSCDTAVYNLLFTDDDLATFDTHFKLFPILRSAQDRDALQQGVKDGTVDAVASFHMPVEIEGKKCELASAKPGVVGVQTLFPALLKALGDLELTCDVLAYRNVGSLGREGTAIQAGNAINAVLFDPMAKWKLEPANHQSKSNNTMFMGQELKGKVIKLLKT